MNTLLIQLILSALLSLLLITSSLTAKDYNQGDVFEMHFQKVGWTSEMDTSNNRKENSFELAIPGTRNHGRKNVNTRYFLFEMGVDIWLPAEDYRIGPNGTIDPFEQRFGNSTNVNLYFFRQRFNLLKHHLNLEYGLGFNFHKIMFDNPIVMQRNDGILDFEYIQGGPDVKVPVKTRLSSNYLTIPLMLNFETNPTNSSKSFRLGAGVYGNTRLGSNFKQKFNNKRGDNIKDKDNFNLSPFRWGIAGQIGYGPINFYANYSMTDVFKENRNSGYEIGMVSVGFIVIPF